MRDRVKRAEKAWNALGLSLVTKVDKERWIQILDGLRALDDEQANVKYAIEELLSENADVGRVTFEQIHEALKEHGVVLEKAEDGR